MAGRKRANGEGGVFQRARDGGWITTVPLPDGKVKTWVSRTEREALQKLKAAHKQIEEGTPPSTKRATVSKFLADWLEETVRPSRDWSTYDSYKWIAAKYIEPSI